MTMTQDTPMQVPLNFYKTWAPEMRKHAKSLGKDRFGIWGEFYVTPARYATMTGRGRDSTMLLGLQKKYIYRSQKHFLEKFLLVVDVYYIKIPKQIEPMKSGWLFWVFPALRYGQDTFIDDVSTMKGGIVYPYYWYIFTAVVYKDPSYADGLVKGLCWGEQDDWHLRPNYRTTWICNVDLLQQSWQLALAKYGKLSSLTHVSCCHHVLAGISEFLKSANWHGFFADEELWDVWYWHSPMSLQSLCTKNIFFFEAWYPIALCGDEQDFDTPGSALDGWAREASYLSDAKNRSENTTIQQGWVQSFLRCSIQLRNKKMVFWNASFCSAVPGADSLLSVASREDRSKWQSSNSRQLWYEQFFLSLLGCHMPSVLWQNLFESEEDLRQLRTWELQGVPKMFGAAMIYKEMWGVLIATPFFSGTLTSATRQLALSKDGGVGGHCILNTVESYISTDSFAFTPNERVFPCYPGVAHPTRSKAHMAELLETVIFHEGDRLMDTSRGTAENHSPEVTLLAWMPAPGLLRRLWPGRLWSDHCAQSSDPRRLGLRAWM